MKFMLYAAELNDDNISNYYSVWRTQDSNKACCLTDNEPYRVFDTLGEAKNDPEFLCNRTMSMIFQGKFDEDGDWAENSWLCSNESLRQLDRSFENNEEEETE